MHISFLQRCFILPFLFIFHNSSGQADTLACPCRIFLKDGTNITNVQAITLLAEGIRYRFSGIQADLQPVNIARIEGVKKIIRQDSIGNILRHDYDILIGKGNDTLEGVIYSVSGNYISFQLTGKNKKGFIPLQAVKDYSWNSRKTDTLHFTQDTPSIVHGKIPGNTVPGSDSSLAGKILPADTTSLSPADSNKSTGGISILPENPTIHHPYIPIELDCQTSYALGMKDASSSFSIFLLGVGGCVSGCLGLGWIAPMITVQIDNIPDKYPAGVNNDCYRSGYDYRKKKENIMASTIGAGVGFALFISLLIANNNAQ